MSARKTGSPLFPVRAIEVVTPLKQAPRAPLQNALRIEGNFFAVDLAELRARLEQLPWVRQASVRRAWPDRVEVAPKLREPRELVLVMLVVE